VSDSRQRDAGNRIRIDHMTTTFRVEAIPAATLSRIRSTGRDEAGNELRARVDDEGGSPLRCCLRDTAPGERVLLIAYTPPGVTGPYAERGPIFVHAAPCPGYPDVDHYPAALGHRRQIVRGYDRAGTMDIQVAHVRNVAAGCYNFAVWPA
jgi:hypothetical protein